MSRVFVDMDGVVVDFDAYKTKMNLSGDEVKATQGSYLKMGMVAGAREGLNWLVGSGYDVWLATKPPTGISFAYGDKAEWVFQNLPEFKRKLIMTHDKGLLGSQFDILIDDRPHKANCGEFPGMLVVFKNWDQAIELIKARKMCTHDPNTCQVLYCSWPRCNKGREK